MSIVFERPIGASSDVSELEYIAALHQTCEPDLRRDGTIRAIDAVHFLSSRYGIRVTEEEVRSTIFRGLADGGGDDDRLDLTELVAILMIPVFIKAVQDMEEEGGDESMVTDVEGGGRNFGDGRRRIIAHAKSRVDFDTEMEYREYVRRCELQRSRRSDPSIVNQLLDMILHDATGGKHSAENPPELTPEIIRTLFRFYGESDLVEDDALIQEMIDAASPPSSSAYGSGAVDDEVGGSGGTPPVRLDQHAFGRALTYDVRTHYDVDKEMEYTTNYYDVFQTIYSTKDKKDNEKTYTERGLDYFVGMQDQSQGHKYRHGNGRASSALTEVSSTSVGGATSSAGKFVREEEAAVANGLCKGSWASGSSNINRNSDENDWEDNPVEVELTTMNNNSAGSRIASRGGGDAQHATTTMTTSSPTTIRPVERIFTAPAIDYTADTYRSKTFVILLWACAISTYFAYLYGFDIAYGRIDCEEKKSSFGCKIANGVTHWSIVMAELIILGTVFIVCGSAGNSIYATSGPWILLGMASIVWLVIIPFIYELETPFYETTKSENPENKSLYYVSLILGCILLLLQGSNLLRQFLPDEFLGRRPRWARLLTPGLAIAESQIKLAAGYKANRLVRNALDVHRQGDHDAKEGETSYGRALLHYGKVGDRYETAGGVLWTWKRLWAGTLFTEEGIWLSSRIVAGNVSQITTCMFILAAGIYLLQREIRYFNEKESEEEVSIFSSVEPERWMVVLPTFVGTFLGFAAALSITLIYTPSAASTMIKYRSGVFPSLRSDIFAKIRLNVDQTTVLFGCIFWGVLYTAIAVALFFGGFVFFLVWHVTRPTVVSICASIIGLAITIGIKMLVLFLLRTSYFAAFYRKKPAQANYMGVALECWNVALTTGYMLARMTKLVLATSLYIGRIDTPLLAPGVRLPVLGELDFYPSIFCKDLLAHDAHRHPYLERLGVMYMLKLRHGQSFARTSGSCWRLLFVFALMPWMRKYRVQNEKDVDITHFRFGTSRFLGQRGSAMMPDSAGSNKAEAEMGVASINNFESRCDDNTTSRMIEENKRLLQEIATMKDENQRLLERIRGEVHRK